jgi:hypothetical protein
MSDDPFCMSIEAEPLKGRLHGFHLGTDEGMARTIVMDHFDAMVRNKQPVITIALMRRSRIVDVFNGEWSSNTHGG